MCIYIYIYVYIHLFIYLLGFPLKNENNGFVVCDYQINLEIFLESARI